MKTLRILGILLLASLTSTPWASDKTISVNTTLGEYAITSLLRNRFSKPFIASLSDNRSLRLDVDDIFLDFEVNSAIFHLSGKVRYVEGGISLEKPININREMRSHQIVWDLFGYSLKLNDIWGTDGPPIPLWVQQRIESEVSTLFTLQEAKLFGQRGHQLTPEYPIFSKAFLLFSVILQDDYATVKISHTVAFDAPNIIIVAAPSPIAQNKPWNTHSFANFKNSVREMKIYPLSGDPVRTQAGTGEWAVLDNFDPDRPWHRIEPLTPHTLGPDVYIMYAVIENGRTFYTGTKQFGTN